MSHCIFCKIISGDASASEVYRDETCIAFLDIHPINPGHVLVVPIRHVQRFHDLEKPEAERMFAAAREIYRAMRSSGIRCEGANFFLSDGEVAGQEVLHTHLHIAPRYAGDGQRIGFRHGHGSRESLDEIALRIRSDLGAGRAAGTT